MMTSTSPWRLLLALVVLAAGLVAQEGEPTALDDGIDDPEARYPVFVRLADQVLPTGAAYRAFCEEHATTARSELRERITSQLRATADRSWEAIAEQVAALEADGGLSSVRRFWIVNGFAADATGAACRELAEREDVALVCLQRAGKIQHRDRERPKRWLRKNRMGANRALRLVQDEEPEYVPTKIVPGNLERMNVPGAWALGATGSGVTIALCDTGVLVCPSISVALWRNPDEELNEQDDDGNGLVDDIFGYDFAGNTPFAVGDDPKSGGTMNAGVAIGRPLPSGEQVGVAPRARLMMLRDTGSLLALEYAVAQGADVFVANYKFGKKAVGQMGGVYRTAFEHMAACGVLAVSGAVGAMPSERRVPRGLILPPDIPCVLSTASAARTGLVDGASLQRSSWSGVRFFDDDEPLAKPDVAAFYGGFPVLTWAGHADRPKGSDPVDLLTGTGNDELPAPQVGAVAALVLSARPELTPWRVAEILTSTAQTLGSGEGRQRFGAGLVQAEAAVKRALEAEVDERDK